MTVPFHIVSENVADILMSAGYMVEMYDEDNNRVYDKAQARKFFTTPDKIMITIHEAGNEKSNLNVSLSQGVDLQKFEDKVGKRLRIVANQAGDNMAYDIRTYGRELSLKDFAHDKTVKEENKMSEINVTEGKVGMTGTTRSSYQKVGECRIIIRHSGKVNEDKFGSRSRNIQAIFVETKGGERFKVAENNLHGARAMARHLSNGGSPFDTVGMKVTEMMSKMSSLKSLMSEVRKIKRNETISEDAGVLTEQIKSQFNSLRETLKKMSGKVGYMTHSADLARDNRVDELGPNRSAGSPPHIGLSGDDVGDVELPSDKMLGGGKYAGQGHFGTSLAPSGKSGVSDEEVFALIASDSRYGRRHMRPETESWDQHEFDLYKTAKAELQKNRLMNSVEEDGSDMEYTTPVDRGPKKPTDFGNNPITELSFRMSEYLEKHSHEMPDQAFNMWSTVVLKMEDLRHSPLNKEEALVAFEAAKLLGVKLPMKASESVYEAKADMEGKSSSTEKKVDSKVTQEMFDVNKRDSLDRANAEAMHSINSIAIEKGGESHNDYGILPENIMLESWFDDMVRVEFYKEEDLELDEDGAPTVEKILPETALHTLNMYLDHPLFKHYIGLYETQGILDEVVSMIQEDSSLYERVHKYRKNMKEDHSNRWMEERKEALDSAFEDLKNSVLERRESLEAAIDRLATELSDVLDDGDPDAKNEAAEALWTKAEEIGMVKHDAGSDFADTVLSPAKEVQMHKDEINAEQYYGDAKFHEDEDDEKRIANPADPSQPPRWHEHDEEKLNDIVALHNDGAAPDDIGYALGIDVEEVLHYLEYAGIDPREINVDDSDIGSDEDREYHGESMEEEEEKMDEELERLTHLAGISVEEGKMDLKHDKNEDGDFDDKGEHIVHDNPDEEEDKEDKKDKKNESIEKTVNESDDEEVDEAKDKEVDEAKDEEVDEAKDDEKEKIKEEIVTDQNLARLITLARYRA